MDHTMVVGLLLLLSGHCLGATLSRSRRDVEISGLTCHDGQCGKLSYSDIRNRFKGLLFTLTEIQEIEEVDNKNRGSVYTSSNSTPNITLSSAQFEDDGGICCSSRVAHITNTSLTNIKGEKKSVIHLADDMEPIYQYIPHAYCVHKGQCEGTCTIEEKIMSILVLDSDYDYTFDVFALPGYCSCKNF